MPCSVVSQDSLTTCVTMATEPSTSELLTTAAQSECELLTSLSVFVIIRNQALVLSLSSDRNSLCYERCWPAAARVRVRSVYNEREYDVMWSMYCSTRAFYNGSDI